MHFFLPIIAMAGFFIKTRVSGQGIFPFDEEFTIFQLREMLGISQRPGGLDYYVKPYDGAVGKVEKKKGFWRTLGGFFRFSKAA